MSFIRYAVEPTLPVNVESSLTPVPAPAVNPVVEPGDVFVLGSPSKHSNRIIHAMPAVGNSDVIINFSSQWPENYNTWGITNLFDSPMSAQWDAMYLFRIDNDTLYPKHKSSQ